MAKTSCVYGCSYLFRVANQLVDVKESIPEHFETAENAGEFWDTHDLVDYLDETRETDLTFIYRVSIITYQYYQRLQENCERYLSNRAFQ